MRKFAASICFAAMLIFAAGFSVHANECVDGPSDQPFGYLDTPLDGYVAVNPAEVPVMGWALSTACIDVVGLYLIQVDAEHLLAQVFPDQTRTDVCTYFCADNYPDCLEQCGGGESAGDVVGWSTVLDLGGLPAGWYPLIAAAVDTEGRSATVATSNILIPRPFGAIEAPFRARCGETCEISGWAMAGLGIQRIMVYMNDTYIGDANLGISRPDVCASYTGYVNPTCENSGWSIPIHFPSECADTIRQIRAVAVDTLGHQTSLPASFDTNDPEGNGFLIQVDCTCDPVPPFGKIDVPVTGQEICRCRDYNLSGWALSDCLIDKIAVYVDDVFMGYAQNMRTDRPDVCNAICYPNCDESGWSFALPARDMTLGTHNIRAVAMDVNAQTTVIDTRTIHVRNIIKPKGFAEYPPSGQALVIGKDQLHVSGWVLADRFDAEKNQSVAKIEFYLDNTKVGELNSNNPDILWTNSLGVPRPDVCAADKNDPYQYPKCYVSGFNFTLESTAGLDPGPTVLRVRAYDSDGWANDIGVIDLSLVYQP